MRKLSLLVAFLMVSQGFAESRYVDSAPLRECGGRVELRESRDNLHLKFDDVMDCDTLVVQTDWGVTLDTYSFRKGGQSAPFSPSYTLSNDMWRQLGRGELVLKLRGRWWTQDTVTLRVNPFGPGNPINPGNPFNPGNPGKCGGHSDPYFTGWALTNACKCAFYRHGQFERHATAREEFKCRP